MSTKSDDPIKKILGKTAKEIFAGKLDSHSKFHSSNAFCGSAGPEEMRHLQNLIDSLSDDEVSTLVESVGINLGLPAKEIDRETLEGVLDEAEREDFYHEFHKLMSNRR